MSFVLFVKQRSGPRESQIIGLLAIVVDDVVWPSFCFDIAIGCSQSKRVAFLQWDFIFFCTPHPNSSLKIVQIK